MSYVEVRQNDEKSQYKRKSQDFLDDALKELKKKLKKEGIMQDLKKHESYMSPSLKRRHKKNEAFKRRKREERKQEWMKKKTPVDEMDL